MNRTPRLSKSGIEYLDYVWNFYSGCDNKRNGVCQVEKCWAEGITERFAKNYPNGFEPTFYPEAFLSPLHLKKPSIIGCAFMGDLFGDWVDPEQKIHADMPSGKASITMSLKGWIFTTIKQCPQHTFLFLTKNPSQLISWGKFPDNCWVGVTATGAEYMADAVANLACTNAKVKFMSFEPLLSSVMPEGLINFLDWVIIGSQTSPKKLPKWEWIEEILNACDKARVPIFLKNNLGLPKLNHEGAMPFYRKDPTGTMVLRQEMPKFHPLNNP